MFQRFYFKLRKVFGWIDRKILGENGGEPLPTQIFSYKKPGKDQQGSKEFIVLSQIRSFRSAVIIVRKGSEDHLHSHPTIDGFWFVLSGRARFHGDNNLVRGEMSAGEGILVPRNTKYWYEAVGDEDLEILQVLSIDDAEGWKRTDYEDHKFDRRTVKRFDARV